MVEVSEAPSKHPLSLCAPGIAEPHAPVKVSLVLRPIVARGGLHFTGTAPLRKRCKSNPMALPSPTRYYAMNTTKRVLPIICY